LLGGGAYGLNAQRPMGNSDRLVHMLSLDQQLGMALEVNGRESGISLRSERSRWPDRPRESFRGDGNREGGGRAFALTETSTYDGVSHSCAARHGVNPLTGLEQEVDEAATATLAANKEIISKFGQVQASVTIDESISSASHHSLRTRQRGATSPPLTAGPDRRRRPSPPHWHGAMLHYCAKDDQDPVMQRSLCYQTSWTNSLIRDSMIRLRASNEASLRGPNEERMGGVVRSGPGREAVGSSRLCRVRSE